MKGREEGQQESTFTMQTNNTYCFSECQPVVKYQAQIYLQRSLKVLLQCVQTTAFPELWRGKGSGGNPYGLSVSLPYRYSDITAFS